MNLRVFLPLRGFVAPSLGRSLLPSLLSVFCFCVLVSSTLAQSPDIPAMIRSDDPAQRKQALTLMLDRIDRDGSKLSAQLVHDWIGVLLDARRTADAGEVARHALPAFKERDKFLSVRLMACMATASLEQGKTEDAITLLQESPKVEPNFAIALLSDPRLTESLVHAGLLKQYLETIDQTIISRADDLGFLERALLLRTNVFLAANRPQEALSSAKSLYTVSGMGNTANALATFTKCLVIASPNDRDLFIRFRDEQLAGAATAASTPAGQSSAPATQPATVKSTVLTQIKVNAGQFERAVGEELLPSPLDEDFGHLIRNGNLLLIADRPQDAKLWFEQAYRTCNQDQVTFATECLARVMKAEDGTIGRANAFLLALRPSKPTTK